MDERLEGGELSGPSIELLPVVVFGEGHHGQVEVALCMEEGGRRKEEGGGRREEGGGRMEDG